MKDPTRRPRSVLMAVVAALMVLSVGMMTGCGQAKAPDTRSSTPPPEPTTKIVKPGGPNSFTPTPITPLSPTAGSAPGGGVVRP